MRTLILLALVATHLGGCASRQPPAIYGSFVNHPTPANEEVMARDVAAKIGALFPPARTRMNLQHAATDTFGTTLVAALRTKGYALSEFKAHRSANDAAVPGKAEDLALAYVLDQPLESNLYRITVHLNSQSVSRLYQSKDGAIAPAGFWVRKE
jgi:hypothetical protein